MYNVLLILLFVFVLAILHSYFFYPLLLFTFSRKGKVRKVYSSNEDLPGVTILMAAYNEEAVIGEKILSVFNTNYPLNKIKFIIGSDSSTDRTNNIVRSFSENHPSVSLVEFKGRTGKIGIINELVKLCDTEIMILTDANVFFEKETIFNLIRYFKDDKVAQVCANIIKVSDTNLGIARQEKTYMALENKIKLQESINWNIVIGAEGGCYAIRRKNFSPVPSNFCVDDFYISMNIIEQGKQIVFDEEAICYEDVSISSAVEFARKVRISMGNFQNLARYKKLLLPFWRGSSYALWSHKVLRWLTPFLLILCFLTSIGLGFYNSIYFIFAGLQLIGILTPLIKINLGFFKIISHFYLMNLALLKGFFIFIKGVDSSIWQPTKRNV